MTTPTTTTTSPTPVTALEAKPIDALTLLANRIQSAHKFIVENSQRILERAIEAGEALNQAKEKLPHGQWLPWLEKNCLLSERTAQVYMKLAANKSVLNAHTKSASAADLADLTLREALRLIDSADDDEKDGEQDSDVNDGDGDADDDDSGNPAAEYDRLEERLIKKLKQLDPDEVEDHAGKTIAALNDTVDDVKSIAKKARKKAA